MRQPARILGQAINRSVDWVTGYTPVPTTLGESQSPACSAPSPVLVG